MAFNANVPLATNQISADLVSMNANWEFLSWCAVVGNIAFPATAVPSADANTLDDYEEGTWTAAFTAGTSGTITIHASYVTGKYVKIGRKVFINGAFFAASVSSPVGALTVTGLPFTCPNTIPDYNALAVRATDLAATATTAIQGHVPINSTIIRIEKFAAGVMTNLAGDVAADSVFFVTGSYDIS